MTGRGVIGRVTMGSLSRELLSLNQRFKAEMRTLTVRVTECVTPTIPHAFPDNGRTSPRESASSDAVDDVQSEEEE